MIIFTIIVIVFRGAIKPSNENILFVRILDDWFAPSFSLCGNPGWIEVVFVVIVGLSVADSFLGLQRGGLAIIS